MKATTIVVAVALGMSAISCTKSDKPEPQVASSATEEGYAERYVEELDGVGEAFVAQQRQAKALMETFEEYPGELKDPSWPHVTGVVERADTAGRSASYVDRVERLQSVVSFFEEEKEPLTKRVGGAVQYEAKKKDCEFDAYSAAARGLEKGLEKQVEESLRERNEAHRYIEQEEEQLGKENLEKLAAQADAISQASYLAHIGVVRTKNRLAPLVAEASQVKNTLDRVIEESQDAAKDPDRSDEAKEMAKARAAAAVESKAQIDQRIDSVEQLQQAIDEHIQTLQADYAKALDALKKQIKEQDEQAGTS